MTSLQITSNVRRHNKIFIHCTDPKQPEICKQLEQTTRRKNVLRMSCRTAEKSRAIAIKKKQKTITHSQFMLGNRPGQSGKWTVSPNFHIYNSEQH